MNENIHYKLRFERKWVFKNANYIDILNKAFKSNFLFRFQYPKRFVNSLYFDDYNHTNIRENLNGISNRKKFRIRWYGKNKFILNNPKLEVKIKDNILNYKRIFPLKILEGTNLKISKNIKFICNEVNSVLKKQLLTATVTTHYERLYLISTNKKIRTTIDYNLEGTNFNCYFQNPIFKTSKDLILEFKYNRNYDNFVRNNLQKISARYSKNSKYVKFFMGKNYIY